MFGDPVLARQRLGQGAFRMLVTDSYQRRCAVTKEKALPVLEAAHIRPVSEGGGHLVTAGFFTLDLGLNNQGVVAFTATLDTSTNGLADTGLYTWSNGTLSLVARTGTVIPGVGTIQALLSPGEEGFPTPISGGEAQVQSWRLMGAL